MNCTEIVLSKEKMLEYLETGVAQYTYLGQLFRVVWGNNEDLCKLYRYIEPKLQRNNNRKPYFMFLCYCEQPICLEADLKDVFPRRPIGRPRKDSSR